MRKSPHLFRGGLSDWRPVKCLPYPMYPEFRRRLRHVYRQRRDCKRPLREQNIAPGRQTDGSQLTPSRASHARLLYLGGTMKRSRLYKRLVGILCIRGRTPQISPHIVTHLAYIRARDLEIYIPAYQKRYVLICIVSKAATARIMVSGSNFDNLRG